MSISVTLKKYGLTKAFDMLYKDPEANLVKLMDWADKFADGELPASALRCVRRSKTPTMLTIPIFGTSSVM